MTPTHRQTSAHSASLLLLAFGCGGLLVDEATWVDSTEVTRPDIGDADSRSGPGRRARCGDSRGLTATMTPCAQAPGGRYEGVIAAAASTSSGDIRGITEPVTAPDALTTNENAAALASSGNSQMP